MPPHWQVQSARNREILARSVAEFWRKFESPKQLGGDDEPDGSPPSGGPLLG